MLNNISWTSYWISLGVFLAFYYGYVLWVYYRADLLQLLTSNKWPKSKKEVQSGWTDIQSVCVAEDVLPVAQSLTEEINAYLDQAALEVIKKPNLTSAIRQIIKKYPAVKNTSCQEVVSRLLQFECKSKCAIHLNSEELKEMWVY